VPVPTTVERPAPRRPDATGGPSFASKLIVWSATALAATCSVFATTTDVAVAAQFSHAEVAEEAGPAEESTANERRARTDPRSSRRRLPAKAAQGRVARTTLWIAQLVIPRSYTSRRGPPSLTV
jgi:hypothetical protein